jgi:aminomethyltransferase
VYRYGEEHFRIVVNAANVDKDLAHFREHAGDLCTIEDRSNVFALVAVQGPAAVELVANVAGEALAGVPSFGIGRGEVAGIPVTAARTGYTGEDGFELFVPWEDAEPAWDALMAAGGTPVGLGARDTLRLEARLSLYGNDIDETTNPFEAGLAWVVKLDKPAISPPARGAPELPAISPPARGAPELPVGFVGQAALREIKAAGLSRKLVGFRVKSRGIVRAGAEVLGDGDAVVGKVTSGGVAPTVGGAVGLAYVPIAMANAGAPLRLRQRSKVLDAEQVKGPFYRRPKSSSDGGMR